MAAGLPEVQKSAQRGAALVKLLKTLDFPDEESLEVLVARAMADLRALSAIADLDSRAVSDRVMAHLEEMAS